MDEIPGDNDHTTDEQRAIAHFKDTYVRDPDGRYRVQLPRKDPLPVLGASRHTAHKRYEQNERSLKRKGTLDAFNTAVAEYEDLGHAEPVPAEDLDKDVSSTFYLPMHGVSKSSSTTTKLRVVFDASAKTASGSSLNDMLLQGPSLYPHLTTIINIFRFRPVGLAADISKMFREIGLQGVELDYHRFLVRDASGALKDNRMSRLTFGVTCSPYLATHVLRQIAEDYRTEFPEAARAIEEFFYVDDCLLSVDTTEEAISISAELVEVFSRACMSLRKWMSSSSSVMASIPEALREADQSTLSIFPVDCPKTLGLHWNTATDSLHIITPPVDNITVPTKRQVASSLARTFDIMGWYSPATVTLKILLQCLWALHLPAELLPAWNTWKEELVRSSMVCSSTFECSGQ